MLPWQMLCRLIARLQILVFTIVGYLQLKLWGADGGSGVRISGWLNVHNRGRLFLGAGVRINSGFRSNPVAGDRRVQIWIFPNADIAIADCVGLSNCTIVSMTHISIGQGTNIGGGCQIYDTDFHEVGPIAKTVASKPVTIGKGCFIGAFSIILKGVDIGDGAVVGAGSVVTRSIPCNEVWAGNPARFVRKL